MSGSGADADLTVDHAALFAGLPTAYLVISPQMVIVDANDAYLQLLGRTRAELVSRPVFEAFPPEPTALDEHGRNPVELSFLRARDTGRPNQLPLLNYDVRDSATGEVRQRYWSLIQAPLLDEAGRCVLLLQRVEDVTDFVQARDDERAQGLAWRRRVEAIESDLFVRAKELQAALQAQETASRRLSAMTEAALMLAAAETVEELTETIILAGLTALGADGGAVAVIDPDGVGLRLSLSDSLGPDAQQQYAQLSLDDPLPAAHAARTGEPVLLPDRAAGLAWSPAMAGVYESLGRDAWASVPLRVGDRLLGSLTASWAKAHPFAPDEIDLLGGFAAQCAQALDRVQVRQDERRSALASRQMSEALQRSLLTEAPQPDDLRIVVRYRPAAEQVQVGGDWYDAFTTPGGATSIVVGDVTGHDREAAAVMGQIRNLLRGIAYALEQPPAAVLSAVDHAVHDLEVGTLATCLLAQVRQLPDHQVTGTRMLRWSSAGHLPPLLLAGDGTSRLLHTDPDLLLGLEPATARHDHEHELAPGSTVLLYTDGLVERRGARLDDSLQWLADAGQRLAHLPPDELCDALLAEVTATADDDIALLVLRVPS